MNVHILPVSERISDEGREAIIEHRRLMKAQRKFAAENREKIAAEWDALPDGRPWTIEDHVAGRKLP